MSDLQRALDDLDHLLADDEQQAAMPSRPLPTTQPGVPASEQDEASRGEVLPAQCFPLDEDDNRDLELLTRFVTGAVLLGADELIARARKWDEQAPKNIGPLAGGQPLEAAGYGALARYLAIGLITSGRRSAVRFMRGALGTPGGLARSLLSATDRLTGTFPFRPFRRPLADAVERVNQTSRDWIEEGWQEEQISRWIASKGIPGIMDDVIHIISQNAELAELVRTQISQQSLGMASSVVDTSRKLSAVGDDVAENVIRRILRRGLRVEMERIEPKEELPPMLDGTKAPASK